MRIIAGKLKGRRLFTPKDNRVRPTTDKVKEALFSAIAPYMDEAVVVDLFAGTGNLGLEAISRGAKYCYFADKSRESLDLIRQNISYCKIEDQCRILQGDFERILDKLSEKIDVFFLDPPYGEGFVQKSLELISEKELLSEDGIIVAEHGIKEKIEGQALGFYKLKEKKYGSIGITIFALDTENSEE